MKEGFTMVVVSDSHGNTRKLERIIAIESPFEYLIHCGDGVNDLIHIQVPEDTTVIRVAGNIDSARHVDLDRITHLCVCGLNIMITHGDRFRVNQDYNELIREGKRLEADAIFFGHTHVRYLLQGKPALFNPGPAIKGSYGVVVVRKGAFEFRHRKLDEQ